jgi:hypothetical protein
MILICKQLFLVYVNGPIGNVIDKADNLPAMPIGNAMPDAMGKKCGEWLVMSSE